uniref:PHD-type domain-containing protein n=1 Tax=Glossina brevipalpis TaxID=37001 RepID=A0A1A9WZD4_9MUSC
MFCRRCWLDFKSNDLYVKCSGPCNWSYHPQCVDLDATVTRELFHNPYMEWYCFNCRQLYRLQLYFELKLLTSEAIISAKIGDMPYCYRLKTNKLDDGLRKLLENVIKIRKNKNIEIIFKFKESTMRRHQVKLQQTQEAKPKLTTTGFYYAVFSVKKRKLPLISPPNKD